MYIYIYTLLGSRYFLTARFGATGFFVFGPGGVAKRTQFQHVNMSYKLFSFGDIVVIMPSIYILYLFVGKVMQPPVFVVCFVPFAPWKVMKLLWLRPAKLRFFVSKFAVGITVPGLVLETLLRVHCDIHVDHLSPTNQQIGLDHIPSRILHLYILSRS